MPLEQWVPSGVGYRASLEGFSVEATWWAASAGAVGIAGSRRWSRVQEALAGGGGRRRCSGWSEVLLGDGRRHGECIKVVTS
jgi:hypothetical protein